MSKLHPECRVLDDVLADLLGGELAGPQRARAEAHLESCPSCRARVAGLRSAREMVVIASGDAAFAERAAGGARTADPMRSRPARPARWLAAAAVLGLMFILGFAAGRAGRAPRVEEAPHLASVPAPTAPIAQRFTEAARNLPRSGSMAWALTSLARRN